MFTWASSSAVGLALWIEGKKIAAIPTDLAGMFRAGEINHSKQRPKPTTEFLWAQRLTFLLELGRFHKKVLEGPVGTGQMRRVVRAFVRLHGTDLNDVVYVSTVFSGIKGRRLSRVRVCEQINLIGAEMPTNRFYVIKVVVDASP